MQKQIISRLMLAIVAAAGMVAGPFAKAGEAWAIEASSEIGGVGEAGNTVRARWVGKAGTMGRVREGGDIDEASGVSGVGGELMSEGCADVEFIFARGSGEKLRGPSVQAWEAAVRQQMETLPEVSYRFYELGQEAQEGFQYPAVAIVGGLKEYGTLAGAIFSGGEANYFGWSVAQGVGEMKTYFAQRTAACPAMKFVLGGYSEGAMTIDATLNGTKFTSVSGLPGSGLVGLKEIDPTKVLYYASFGDPKIFLPEGYSKVVKAVRGTRRTVPAACRGEKLSEYREYVPNCKLYEGSLGGYRPYRPEAYIGKVGTWCNQKDIVCGSGLSVDDHVSYAATNRYMDAAKIAVGKVREVYRGGATTSEEAKHLINEIAVLFDTTGSMTGMIEAAKKEIASLTEQVAAAGGQIALIEYRDLTADKFDPRVACDFSCTANEVIIQLNELQASGGGDEAESALSAAMKALNSLSWHEGATKSILVVTDAPYLAPDRDDTTVAEVAKRSLEIDPVNVYVWSTARVAAMYQELIEATNGGAFIYGKDALTEVFDNLLTRPEARLEMAEYQGYVGEEFRFDASGSYVVGQKAEAGGLTFEWDLNGDGSFVEGGTVATKVYNAPFKGFVQVRVTDESGNSATMSAHVEVMQPGEEPLLTEITGVEVSQGVEIGSAGVEASQEMGGGSTGMEASADAEVGTYAEMNTRFGLDAGVEDDPKSNIRIDFTTTGVKTLVALGGAPAGVIATEDGRGGFTVNGLEEEMEIALVPYSAKGARGMEKRFLVKAGEVVAIESEPEDEEDNYGGVSGGISGGGSGTGGEGSAGSSIGGAWSRPSGAGSGTGNTAGSVGDTPNGGNIADAAAGEGLGEDWPLGFVVPEAPMSGTCNLAICRRED